MIKSLGKYEKRLAIFLAIGILIRIFISTKTAYYQDINIFKLWSLDLITQGFRNFYSVAISDYLPGYLYVVWFLGKVFWWFLNKGVLLPFELVYKSPSILTDVATTLLIFQITKEYTNKKIAYLTSLFYFLNPVFFFNSTIWGQVESYTFFFMLLATFFFLRKNYFMSFAVLGYAQSIKPIAILILPIFLLLLILEKIQFKKILFYSLVFILVVFAVFTPFNPGENIISFVIERHGITSSFYQLTSLNAFNFWAMFSTLPSGNTYKLSDQTEFLNITYQYWGYAVFLSFYLGILYFLIKRFVNYEKNKIYIFYLLIDCSVSQRPPKTF